ncbi:ABC transporter ATP-binding protein [Egibacter rhizosphaerae]|uniref:ABC transporter ATP-binding protein n=1 Tax=Egibacter rhizosphaerae TaxID=1670831 RepID=A0A411YID8_9ACTN|nr:ABC transporter ATP-binding protein [Egibacter rhizosphaerae]QBI20911.1 ABC transporter ATP-binding protein [Egibacter rhizosphaerae]
MLEISGLHAAYGDARVLSDISLSVGEGEIVALLGPNGAGKTTLVKSASGTLPPTAGTVRLGDAELTRLRLHHVAAAGLAVVPEGRRLFTRLTVLDNLEVGAYTREARAHLDETLARVYELFPVLRDRTQQQSGTLSGGEQQMLAIGRALMARPRFLLMDEPSLGLSPLLVGQMFALIQQVAELGLGVLLVEQNVAQALEVSQRGYVLEEGSIVEEGTREQLLASPRVREAYLAL